MRCPTCCIPYMLRHHPCRIFGKKSFWKSHDVLFCGKKKKSFCRDVFSSTSSFAVSCSVEFFHSVCSILWGVLQKTNTVPFGDLLRFLCPVRFILLFKVMFPNELLVPFHFLVEPLNFFWLQSLSRRTSLWNPCGYLRFPIFITRLFCVTSCKAETSTYLPTYLTCSENLLQALSLFYELLVWSWLQKLNWVQTWTRVPAEGRRR
jgi:hypothetical protein